MIGYGSHYGGEHKMRRLKKDIWPVYIRIKTNDLADDRFFQIQLWLEEQFGKEKKFWTCVIGFNHVDYYFKNPKDSNWFALRWI